jgi:hypothetical protein
MGKFKGQRQWVREVLHKFDEVEKLQPKLVRDMDADWPEWVRNLFGTLLGVSHPGLQVKNAKNWKANDLGKLLGRHYGLEHAMWGEVALNPKILKGVTAHITWVEGYLKIRRPDLNLDELVKQLAPEHKAWRPKLTECLQETLASACERPYPEGAAFFEAFGKAAVIKADDLLTERTVGEGGKICWVLLLQWRDVERFESVGQLHRYLEKIFKPAGIEIKYKRIEKLCQRIKLKFRAPGRPPDKKNSDK